MSDDFKLFWKLYYEWYPNNKILKDFENLLSLYLIKDKGKILDVGCGQSPYILDFLSTSMELHAVDSDLAQLHYLEKRVIELGYSSKRIDYFNVEFPNKIFEKNIYDGVVLSNILHFYNIGEAIKLILELEKNITKDSIILSVVHCWKYKGERGNYFKHFYNKADISKLFPKAKYQYLYFAEIESLHTLYYEQFLCEWIKEVCIRLRKNQNPEEIKKLQRQYLKDKRENNYTIVVKKK